MPRKIFISYQRLSKEKVTALVTDVSLLGYDVWFDQELGGGQNWWNTILESIRKCDIFIFAITEKALESMPCKLEYKYADSLNKPIFPVLIDGNGVSMNILPPELSKIHFIDYQNQNRETALLIAKSLSQIPQPKPLPDPLPDPPDVPIPYMGTILKQVETDLQLNFESQTSLLKKIKKTIHESPTHESILLLKKFRNRKDLLASIADEIDELLDKEDDLSRPFMKRKKNQIFLMMIFLSIFVSIFTYSKIKSEQNFIDSCVLPDWVLNPPRTEYAIHGIGIARHENLEIAQKLADNLARRDIDLTIKLNIENFLKETDKEYINKSISIAGCKIIKRKICQGGLVFSLAVRPLSQTDY